MFDGPLFYTRPYPTMLKDLLPHAIRQGLKQIYWDVLDTSEELLGQRDRMIPPRSKVFVGAGDFVAVGQIVRRCLIEQGGLKPHETVLDVGCGIGRIAYQLTDYLAPPGSYEGFDIVKMGIDWCQQRITPRFPQFRFQQADVYNFHYHPAGQQQAIEYRFPFADEQFDFVFLTSVFTHMPPDEVAHYVAEVARVLKPGGRVFVTFFLLNDESRGLMTEPDATYNFQHELPGRYVINPDNPDAVTAYAEPWVLDLLDQHGLNAPRTIYPGSWSGRPNSVLFQDIIVAYKG
jgi:SAM-dependent methyltransferase